ncbi:DUF5996 family protein [Streptomyces mirabilis]|uniref:DUF5996 family protein n=1 Tax=Streptomyces mirabilis TaxID=68239 RepID=UPI0022556304|nr:DUF5996 family protein [Streptomyces mirabilis]MCX4427066.1 DUF5996 family protein [Streptomyces mirabilis]
MSERLHAWPVLIYEDLAPMVACMNRLIVLDVTPRGLRTPTLRQRDDVTFTVHYRLLDGDVVIEADTGSRTVSFSGESSVAAFYSSFCRAAGELGIRRPGSPLLCEIPDAPASFEEDHVERH